MARVDIVEIDDQLMEWFAHRAKRLGQTEQQLARSLIEREARSEQTWQTLEDSSSRMRDRLKRMGKYESATPSPRHRNR
jgi:phage shock protein A